MNYWVGDKVIVVAGKFKDRIGRVTQIELNPEGGFTVCVDIPDYGIFVHDSSYFSFLSSPDDQKKSFFTKLGNLLKEFDARIYNQHEDKLLIDLGVHRGNYESIQYQGEINPNNIMNYD